MMWLALLLVVIGYVAGSVPTGVLVCRAMGLDDPRRVGSKNPGATNVLRTGSKQAAAATLLGDIAKGLLPVLLAGMLAGEPWAVALTALAAFLGHLFPVFLGFRGGKGVATALGGVLGFAWAVALAMIVTWLAVASATRYSSLSALVSAVLAPLYTAMIAPEPAYICVVLVIAALLVWRHRDNVRRLMDGTEGKIGA